LTYSRILKPIFYTDSVNWMKLNGRAKSDTVSLPEGTFNTGYDIYDAFDLQPQNLCSFNTGSGTEHQVIAIDFGVAVTLDSIIILNHNMTTAEATFRVANSTSAIDTAGGGDVVQASGVAINAEEDTGVITSDTDGDSVFNFTAVSKRYWAVEFMDAATYSATDLTVGAIIIGLKYALPFSPDLSVGHGFGFDGVSISTGMSGKKHSSPRWIKANNTSATASNYIPFRAGVGATQIPGREYYSFSYSTVADTNLLPSNLGVPTGNSFTTDVMSKTGWNACPMVMGIDSTSTTIGDYLFCRFRESSLSMNQTAHQVLNTSFSVEQEF
jgi:hypothetical protein